MAAEPQPSQPSDFPIHELERALNQAKFTLSGMSLSWCVRSRGSAVGNTQDITVATLAVPPGRQLADYERAFMTISILSTGLHCGEMLQSLLTRNCPGTLQPMPPLMLSSRVRCAMLTAKLRTVIRCIEEVDHGG